MAPPGALGSLETQLKRKVCKHLMTLKRHAQQFA